MQFLSQSRDLAVCNLSYGVLASFIFLEPSVFKSCFTVPFIFVENQSLNFILIKLDDIWSSTADPLAQDSWLLAKLSGEALLQAAHEALFILPPYSGGLTFQYLKWPYLTDVPVEQAYLPVSVSDRLE